MCTCGVSLCAVYLCSVCVPCVSMCVTCVCIFGSACVSMSCMCVYLCVYARVCVYGFTCVCAYLCPHVGTSVSVCTCMLLLGPVPSPPLQVVFIFSLGRDFHVEKPQLRVISKSSRYNSLPLMFYFFSSLALLSLSCSILIYSVKFPRNVTDPEVFW